ncbi:uncharacterized protein LOC129881759 [Solanum dulcamara]|uniref:uncharacterized protein LOC129881759 n=1 Tax=Solanum dulcamara TaxID=45834 RepID=UPI002484F86C|nr:uncharacterized protein LOC129881759 [Solanum dulcamara]
MGKNQNINKESHESQSSQGVCEKIFKLAVNISPTYRSFRRISTVSTKPKIDHQRNDTANIKAIISKPAAIADQLELNRQQITYSQDKYHQNLSTASNMVCVEYNHIAGDDSATNKFNKAAESMKAMNKSSINNMITIVHHHEINEGPKDDNDRFSNYIDHVKNKMRSISSFDDDKVTHYSKFKIN